MAAPTFNNDIRALFRAKDINAMKKVHVPIDLSSYSDVKTHAVEILKRLETGDMPCDGGWPPEWIETFDEWIKGGCLEA